MGTGVLTRQEAAVKNGRRPAQQILNSCALTESDVPQWRWPGGRLGRHLWVARTEATHAWQSSREAGRPVRVERGERRQLAPAASERSVEVAEDDR